MSTAGGPPAERTAAGLSAEVVLYHVFEREESEEQVNGTKRESADPAELANHHGVVQSATTTFREHGVSFSIAAATADPADAFTEYVTNHGINHVFIGPRRRSPF